VVLLSACGLTRQGGGRRGRHAHRPREGRPLDPPGAPLTSRSPGG